jgi:hypothetical protein
MKKLFTLVAMAFMAIGANAQSIVAEVDWTQKSEWDLGWYGEGCTVSVNQGEGLIIDCTPAANANYWEPQVPMIGHIATIDEGGQYQVKFQFNSPVAGELRLDFYSWDGSGATMATVFEVAQGDNDMTIDFLDYPTPCTDAGIFYQCGKLPGKHVVKKVQVFDLEGDEGGEGGEVGPAIVAEVDWTQKSEWDLGWYGEGCTVTVNQGEGLIIDCTPAANANYWEPQIPMIGHIAEIAEGGQYQVQFGFISPVAGELRLDFYSWDGSGATMATVFEVAEGENDLTIDFLDYPTPCTDAGVFYQCGKLPGKHVIKYVKVIDLEADAIQSVKATKNDGAIYNLAGQKVSASYKGVVIKNGKKYLQK